MDAKTNGYHTKGRCFCQQKKIGNVLLGLGCARECRCTLASDNFGRVGIIEKSCFLSFAVIVDGIRRGVRYRRGTAERTEISGLFFPFVLCVPWFDAILADPAENRAKTMVFSGNTGNLPQ